MAEAGTATVNRDGALLSDRSSGNAHAKPDESGRGIGPWRRQIRSLYQSDGGRVTFGREVSHRDDNGALDLSVPPLTGSALGTSNSSSFRYRLDIEIPNPLHAHRRAFTAAIIQW